MSIYRQFGKGAPGYGPAPAAKKEPARLQDWSARRKADPATVLLDGTARWITTLPTNVQPHVLVTQFPRVANLLCANWRDPPSFKNYIDELLIDGRRIRQGFPPEVVGELLALRTYCHAMHPNGFNAWSQVGKRSMR